MAKGKKKQQHILDLLDTIEIITITRDFDGGYPMISVDTGDIDHDCAISMLTQALFLLANPMSAGPLE